MTDPTPIVAVEPLHPVTSSACIGIGYDDRTKRLAVQYVSGHIYYYADVQDKEAADLITAESIGKAVNALRKTHAGQRVSGPCFACGAEGLIGHRCADCGCATHREVPRKERHAEEG